MKLRIFIIVAVSFLSIVFTPALSLADMMWEQEDTVDAGGTTETIKQKIYLSGSRFAIVSGDGLRMVLDMTQGTLSTIDAKEKSYFSVSLTEMTALRERLTQETDTIIEEALTNIPEDQREEYRKQIEKKLSEIKATAAEKEAGKGQYSSHSETREILGYTTSRYSLDSDDRKEELWCTREVDTSELELLLRDTKKIKLLKDIGTNFSALQYGFPLMSVIDDGSMKVSSQVTVLSFDRIDPAIFTVPANFTRISE